MKIAFFTYNFAKSRFFVQNTCFYNYYKLHLSQINNNMDKDIKFIKEEISNIEQEGIIVARDLSWPTASGPFVSDCLVITIVEKGHAELIYDSHDVYYGEHDISIVYPGHILSEKSISEDFNQTAILVTNHVFEKICFHNIHLKRFVYDQYPHFHLTDEQHRDLSNALATMDAISHMNSEMKQNMLVGMLEIIINMIHIYRTANTHEIGDEEKQRLSWKLYEVIKKNCRQHRDVKFYAEQFHLSPKHFSTMIKKETGYSLGHWVHLYVISEAKMLLKTEADASLQEISDTLGFPDLPTFSRYFKRETGMTPSEFKKK